MNCMCINGELMQRSPPYTSIKDFKVWIVCLCMLGLMPHFFLPFVSRHTWCLWYDAHHQQRLSSPKWGWERVSALATFDRSQKGLTARHGVKFWQSRSSCRTMDRLKQLASTSIVLHQPRIVAISLFVNLNAQYEIVASQSVARKLSHLDSSGGGNSELGRTSLSYLLRHQRYQQNATNPFTSFTSKILARLQPGAILEATKRAWSTVLKSMDRNKDGRLTRDDAPW